MSADLPPVALITYSTHARGGVAHTLALGEAMHRLGAKVLVVGLGDPAKGFFRTVDCPNVIVPGFKFTDEDLETKVDINIDTLEEALREIAVDYPILHTQDCISARSAARVREAGAPIKVVRTVHHVDDFDTEKLMECQKQAILEPDGVFVVSKIWQQNLRNDYDTETEIVTNGVDLDRYSTADAALVAQLRERVGCTEPGTLLLAIGGIEPRKGTDTLVEALALLRQGRSPAPKLVVVGGHSFQDHRWYRDKVLERMPELGLNLGTDIIELGTVPEEEMAAWYHAADVLAFPSTKEGFGMAALEAMCAGNPVVTSDLPVFAEWFTPGVHALTSRLGDADDLAAQLARALDDEQLRAELVEAGREKAEEYSWTNSARRHLELYADIWGRR